MNRNLPNTRKPFRPTQASKRPCTDTTGFASPAEDYAVGRLDLATLLQPNPVATFLMRADCDGPANIKENDILVVDRSLDPRLGDLVIMVDDGAFTFTSFPAKGDFWGVIRGVVQLKRT